MDAQLPVIRRYGEAAVAEAAAAIRGGTRTPDLGGTASTREMGDAVLAAL